MKPRIFATIFLISLFFKYYPAQNKLLRLYLESGKSFEQAKKLIPMVIKLRKMNAFLAAVSRNISLKNNEKRMIRALVYMELSFFEKAWEQLKNINTSHYEWLRLKERILFKIREVDQYINLHKEYDFKSGLTENEKKDFLSYAYTKRGPEIAKLLQDSFGIDCDWINMLPKEEIIQLSELFNSNREKFINHLNSYSNNQIREILFYLLRTYESDDKYKEIIRMVFQWNNRTKFIPDNLYTTWGDLYTAEKLIKEQNFLTAYKKLIKAYEKGERSHYLKEMLIEVFKKGDINTDLNKLERMVIEGFIDLTSTEFIELLEVKEKNVVLYQYLNIENVTPSKFVQFLEYILRSDFPQKNKLLQIIVEKLYAKQEYLPLNEEILSKLSTYVEKNTKFAVVKGKWLIHQQQTEELMLVVKSFSGKEKYWVLMQLINEAYELNHYHLSLQLAEKARKIKPLDPLLLRKLASIHHRMGNITEKLATLKKLRLFTWSLFKTEYEIAKDEVNLTKHKWNWDKKVEKIEGEDSILHVLNKSLPEINGYTIRSKEIIHHQKNIGINPIVVTKIGWPTNSEVGSLEYEIYEGIRHYRLFSNDHQIRLNTVPMSVYFNHYANEFYELLKLVKPKIVHAASNFQNALPALEVAKKAGIPTVYEVRGLWQDSTASKIPEFDNSERYFLHQEYEIYCCHLADRVVTISESLAKQLIEFGIDENKIDIVPNGVDTSVFVPQSPNQELIKKYQLQGKTVYGFIGSITKYEGLDYFLKAFAKVIEKNKKVHFLLVGDGSVVPELQSLTKELDIAEFVTFVGRVPHTEVRDYYSVIDIFPFPRTNKKVCRLVTPLKPYEVMAMGKLALVSNIPALNEMVTEGETGIVFEAENVDFLYRCLLNAPNYKGLGLKSRKWVEENRDWSILIKKYQEIYNKVLQ